MPREACLDGCASLVRVLGVQSAFVVIDAQIKRHLEYPARALVEYRTDRGTTVRHYVDLGMLRPRRRPRFRRGDTLAAWGSTCTFLHWHDADRDVALVQFDEADEPELVSAFELTGD